MVCLGQSRHIYSAGWVGGWGVFLECMYIPEPANLAGRQAESFYSYIRTVCTHAEVTLGLTGRSVSLNIVQH